MRGAHISEETRAEVRRLLAAGLRDFEIVRETGVTDKTIRSMRRAMAQTAAWSAPKLPSSDLPLDELIARREAESERNKIADAARELIPVQIRTPGPIGLLIFGDPHVDNPGCDFKLLKQHLDIAAPRAAYLFPVDIGDLTDNWVGRLERLYASSSTTKSDAWRLVEWYLGYVRWLVHIDGNHDVWSGDNDPLKWIARGNVGVSQRHGARIALEHPCGAVTRAHFRHDFKGNSQYNGLHGHTRELLFGQRDHLLVSGHRHFGEDAAVVNADGIVSQMLRVSGYKVVDDYARQGQFPRKPMHPAAVVVLDPQQPETSRGRVWCAPTVEQGAEYLDWLRARYEGRARIVVRAAKSA